MVKWLRRVALGVAGLALLVVAVGASWEALSRAGAAKAFPPPGRLVDIGKRRIQLDCRGAGAPVVVFESGLDSLGSLSWARVHDETATFTRACAYSRAGVMWSDAAPGPFSAERVADDLHRALAVAGEKPPYLLVGHSLGGPYALVFVGRYPADVAGLVFVDASHPDQIARLRAAAGKDLDQGVGQLKLGNALAWTGLVRLITARGPVAPPTAPAKVSDADRALLPSSVHEMLSESEGLAKTLASAGLARRLGDRPIVVLTHGVSMSAVDLAKAQLSPAQGVALDVAWQAMQREEATWSSRGRQAIVAGATHYIQLDRPDSVVSAIREVVGDIKAKPAPDPRLADRLNAN